MISVVVPTRDRPQALAGCLQALSRQTAAVEVVVVDDASVDARSVRDAVAAGRARLIRGAGAGPAAARNLGAQAATGTVVCFTDDDCLPAPEWAQRLAAACAGGGAAAGTTVADPRAGRAAAAAQLLTHTLQLSSYDAASATLGFAPTCNLACDAALARELAFDASFPLAAGEDRDWCTRLRGAGHPLRFVPDATVVHRPLLDVRAMLRQQARYGRGAVAFRRAGGELSGRAFYRRLARAALHAGPATTVLIALAQTAVAAGMAQELAARR